jgi:hypothetical protein
VCDKRHGGGEHGGRQIALLPAHAQIALGERQAMKLAKRLRHGGEIALQHDHVAWPELHRAQAVRNAPSTPAHG